MAVMRECRYHDDGNSDEDVEVMQADLRRILYGLGLGDHVRTISAHEVVMQEVLPRIRELRADEPDRPDPVDPSTVRVGDVVEVRAEDGSWWVGGKVLSAEKPDIDYPIQIEIDTLAGPTVWPCVPGNIVRVLRPAKPEPDPPQVAALSQVMAEFRDWHRNNPVALASSDVADWLYRRGVRVDEGARR